MHLGRVKTRGNPGRPPCTPAPPRIPAAGGGERRCAARAARGGDCRWCVPGEVRLEAGGSRGMRNPRGKRKPNGRREPRCRRKPRGRRKPNCRREPRRMRTPRGELNPKREADAARQAGAERQAEMPRGAPVGAPGGRRTRGGAPRGAVVRHDVVTARQHALPLARGHCGK